MPKMVPKEINNSFAAKLPYMQRLTKKDDFILQTLMETIEEVKVHPFVDNAQV